MRRRDEARRPEQGRGGGRLGLEHVERGAADLAAVERVLERSLVDQPAARAIDDAHARLDPGQSVARQDAAGLVGQRRVQRDEIGAAQQFVEFDPFDAHRHGAFRRQERIIGDNLHPEPYGAVGDNRADIAATDQAERLAGKLDAHEAVLLPLARLGRLVGLRDLAG